VLLTDGKRASVPQQYQEKAEQLKGNPKLSERQALNLELNLQLIELESIRNDKEGVEDDVFDEPGQPPF
jgi:hypothetical protein